MRKVIFQMALSLDGFFEGPKHEIDWHVVDEEFNDYADKFLHSVDTLLFGRATYELMANFWPSEEALRTDPIIAGHMNSLPKVVFSRSLQKAEWENTQLVDGNPVEEVRKLKQMPGKDMAIFGSANLADTLINANLIDEYRMIVMPVILGKGKPAFSDVTRRVKLMLINARTFKSGNVMLKYAPAG